MAEFMLLEIVMGTKLLVQNVHHLFMVVGRASLSPFCCVTLEVGLGILEEEFEDEKR